MEIPLSPFTSFEELAPPIGENDSIFIVGYEVQGLPASDLVGPVACDLQGVRVLFLKGRLAHREDVEVTRYWVDEKDVFNVAAPPTKIVKTPEAIHSVFVSPYTKVEETNSGEMEAVERINIVAGLVASFQGRNVIFRKIFENTYSYNTKQASAWSEPLVVPLTLPRPVLTREGCMPIVQAEKGRQALDQPDRHRVDLSLRWLSQALYSIGVDAFLKYWFAIETLAMPTETDIKPLNALLASLYHLPSPTSAKEKFHTGLLFGLRSRVVHNGLLVPIDGRILRYCECLHHDVLRQKLKMPAVHRLGALLSHGTFDYGAHLRSLL